MSALEFEGPFEYPFENTVAEITDYIEEEIQKRVETFVEMFRLVGEECVNIARVKAQAIPRDYTDQTGNLRSSIGYAIIRDGVLVEAPTVVPITKEGREGEPRARAYISELQSEYSEGLVLIVVAGMDYAAYVQAKGYDVLRSAELTMEEMLERMVAKLTDVGIL